MIWDTHLFETKVYEGNSYVALRGHLCDDCLPLERLTDRRPIEDNRLKSKLKLGDFTKPEDGSEARYDKRKAERPWLKHTAWWFVHNCVAHVLIGILPLKPFFEFHDWTSRKMHGK
jgi:hypothetical protein